MTSRRNDVKEKYGNLFDMCERITGENAYETPMRIYPAVHYTMGRVWIDYNLMSTIPGLHILDESNFSDHDANHFSASTLMQELADGYFSIPYTLGDYIAGTELQEVTADHEAFKAVETEVKARIERLLSVKDSKTVQEFHREIGHILWDHVGIARNEAGLKHALVEILRLRAKFWENVMVPGSNDMTNKNLEFAERVADYMELGELIAFDALHRWESCGRHFREESQSPEG